MDNSLQFTHLFRCMPSDALGLLMENFQQIRTVPMHSSLQGSGR